MLVFVDETVWSEVGMHRINEEKKLSTRLSAGFGKTKKTPPSPAPPRSPTGEIVGDRETARDALSKAANNSVTRDIRENVEKAADHVAREAAPEKTSSKDTEKPRDSKKVSVKPSDCVQNEQRDSEIDKKSARKKLNVNRVMVTKVYDLEDCHCSEDMDSVTLGGLAMGRQDESAATARRKNRNPNAITDLHIREVPCMTSAALLAEDSTSPAHLSTATPRTKEAVAKRKEARKKAIKALKSILENKNLRLLAREVSDFPEFIHLGIIIEIYHSTDNPLDRVGNAAKEIPEIRSLSKATPQRVTVRRVQMSQEDEPVEAYRCASGMTVTVAKQGDEQDDEILISIKSPNNAPRSCPRGVNSQTWLPEPPEMGTRRRHQGNHISTVKMSQVRGQFEVRSNSGGVDLVQTSPLHIPWQAFDDSCEICRHLVHLHRHMSLGDCRVPESRKDRAPESAGDDTAPRDLQSRKTRGLRKDVSSKERATSKSPSRKGRRSSPSRKKAKSKKDDKSSKEKGPKDERKRFVKALEKMISFKPQSMLSGESEQKKPASKRSKSSKGKAGKKAEKPRRRGERESSTQGTKRVPKSRKSRKNPTRPSRDKSPRSVKKSSKKKAPRTPKKTRRSPSTSLEGGRVAERASKISATASSVIDYDEDHAAIPGGGFERSSELDMPILKGGGRKPRGEALSNCSPAAVEEFPRPHFTFEERKSGWLALYAIVAIYMFVCLTTLCDAYFIPAIEVLTETLNIDDSVAGATFMAGASSVPAIASSLIAILIAKGDLGVSTALGSAVLNSAGVVGVGALFATELVMLSRWPLYRDCSFCFLSMLVMVIAMYDDVIMWYESTGLLLLYFVYILLMIFDKRLRAAFTETFNFLRDKPHTNVKSFPPTSSNTESRVSVGAIMRAKSFGDPPGDPQRHRSGLPSTNRFAEPVISYRLTYSSGHDEGIVVNSGKASGRDKESDPNTASRPAGFEMKADASAGRTRFDVLTYFKGELLPPKGTLMMVLWIFYLPFLLLFVFTIPNCLRTTCRKFFVVALCMSVFYITIASYLLVWMISVIGFTLDIPDAAMGLTFLAIGVTLPDVVISVLIIRKGHPDMAISNAIASNIVEILVGLALPWLVKTLFVAPGQPVSLQSRGMLYFTVYLLLTLVFLIVLTHMCGWVMTKLYGTILIVWYVVFLTVSVSHELGYLGGERPITCPSSY
ncbi:uncharacterized protein LOC100902645 [Galendromus occidentalis]|uniref:Uncharacterized protein LOC100902645 n=1 Tax=Galendromus occidentalis TaxID=34638 RepID=A0AAJ6VYT3_9ACAR|nr:uncharacterized protein LOC100902645 [Galendromus occidentalis]